MDSEDHFISILNYIATYGDLFNLLIMPVLVNYEDTMYNEELLIHCTACNYTSDMLEELFISNKSSRPAKIQLIEGVKVNEELNFKVLNINKARKMFIFKSLVIEWISIYQFLRVNIQSAEYTHVFVIIYYNKKAYFIQSYQGEFNVTIDIYDSITEIIQLLIEIFDNDDRKAAKYLFHTDDHFKVEDSPYSETAKFITMRFYRLNIPTRITIENFLSRHFINLNGDPNLRAKYQEAIEDSKYLP